MNIGYHGTDQASAEQILRHGFRPWTYFAAHLEDALAFGGPFVFEIRFRWPAPDWQFKCRRRIPVKQIRSLTHYVARNVAGEDLAKIFGGYRKEKSRMRPMRITGNNRNRAIRRTPR